jgi:hypothetical protein
MTATTGTGPPGTDTAAAADSSVGALFRALVGRLRGQIHVPFPARHGAELCCMTCGVRWLCEMSLSRRRGVVARGWGRLTMW